MVMVMTIAPLKYGVVDWAAVTEMTMMMVTTMMMTMMTVITKVPLNHGVVDWAAVGQEEGVAEVFHLQSQS